MAGNTGNMARQSRPAELPPILLTRPVPQSDRFAGQIRARFGPQTRVITSPVLAPDYLDANLPADLAQNLAGLIFTSETAVAALARLWPTAALPAWCVGDRTAEAARRAGHAARSASGDAAALVAAILADPPAGRLLHARGADSRGDVATHLTAAGIQTVEVTVYAQRPQPLSDAALHLLAAPAPVIVPLFSPRSAVLFTAARSQGVHLAPLWVAALSPAVVQAAQGLHPSQSAIARRPDAAALLDAIEALIAAATQP